MALDAGHIAAQAGAFEPQRQDNFSIEIQGLEGADIIVLSLNGLDIPRNVSEPQSIPYQNEARTYAGKTKPAQFTLSVRDYIDQRTRAILLNWRRQVYNPVTGSMGLARDYKKQANIILHGPDGSNERVGTVIGCWPPEDPGGTLAMDQSGQVLIEFPLQCDKVDWAELT